MDPITSFNFIPGLNLDDKRFTVEELTAAESVVQQTLQDRYPTLDVSRSSTIFDVGVRQQAVLHLLNRAMNEALRKTQSLLGVLQNPELAQNGVVDEILSNVLITRRAGNQATGRVKINVSRQTVYVINQDLIFTTVSGATFAPTGNFRAMVDATQADHLKLYPTDSTNTQFYFLVPVMAVEVGINGRLVDGVEMTPSPSIPFLITSTAFGNFQGGVDDESNEDLIKRIPEGLSARNQVSRSSISATLKENFPEVRSVAVQGMNDLAMTRNAGNLLSLKMPGYADIYVRTSPGILIGNTVQVANLVEIGEDNNAIYSVILDRDIFPGHYMVRSIRPYGEGELLGSYEIRSETKSFNTAVVDPYTDQVLFPNKINTFSEAAYSRYQTNEIHFRIEYDPSLGTVPTDQFSESISVSVDIGYLPSISEIQNFVMDRSRGVVLADYLVKAVVPCFVEFSQVQVYGTPEVDIEQIKQVIFNHVNSLDGPLRVDSVVSIIHGIAGVRGVTLPLRLTGYIYAPDGRLLQIESSSILEIPNYPDIHVTPETTAFFLELSAIPVALIHV